MISVVNVLINTFYYHPIIWVIYIIGGILVLGGKIIMNKSRENARNKARKSTCKNSARNNARNNAKNSDSSK